MTTGIESNTMRSIIQLAQVQFPALLKQLEKVNKNLESIDSSIQTITAGEPL